MLGRFGAGLLQTLGEAGAEFDTPKANCFAADDNSSFIQQIFDVSMTWVESIVEPYCITDDVWGPPR